MPKMSKVPTEEMPKMPKVPKMPKIKVFYLFYVRTLSFIIQRSAHLRLISF